MTKPDDFVYRVYEDYTGVFHTAKIRVLKRGPKKLGVARTRATNHRARVDPSTVYATPEDEDRAARLFKAVDIEPPIQEMEKT